MTLRFGTTTRVVSNPATKQTFVRAPETAAITKKNRRVLLSVVSDFQ